MFLMWRSRIVCFFLAIHFHTYKVDGIYINGVANSWFFVDIEKKSNANNSSHLALILFFRFCYFNYGLMNSRMICHVKMSVLHSVVGKVFHFHLLGTNLPGATFFKRIWPRIRNRIDQKCIYPFSYLLHNTRNYLSF